MQMKNPFLGPLSGFRLPLLAGALLSVQCSASAAPLSLDAYLGEVTGQSPALQSSLNIVEGSKESAKEGNLVTMPRFFLTGSRTTDHRQFYNAFMGGRSTADNFNLGFEKPFSFGLNAKLSYNLLNNNTSNLPAFAYPPNGTLNYTAAQTQLDLNQSLWRNFFGKEIRATTDLAEASSLATHYGERFKLKQTLAQAETAYHRLAIANESVRLERELLDRSKKILDWTEKRVNNHLSDKIDLLQSRAGYQVRQISLRNALDELRTAALSFNQFRNRISPEVTEEVSIPPTKEILALPVPAKAPQTDDVLAAEQSPVCHRRIQRPERPPVASHVDGSHHQPLLHRLRAQALGSPRLPRDLRHAGRSREATTRSRTGHSAKSA
ncbi:MAG: TolC family protein [Proteobacteria bacterium]|nr:TolC family protein [Pseudomonadota bacterium]